VAGWFSGGMVGVLVSRIVASLTHAPSCPDIPTCDWAQYALAGAILGLVTLPTMVFLRLRRSDAQASNSE
jgi:hypothetical protein